MVVVPCLGMGRIALLAVALLVLLAACGGEEAAPPDEGTATFPGFRFAGGDIEEGGTIAVRFTCDGEDVSPALAWEGVPDGTAELALLVDDPDANGFTHWLAYAIPPDATSLPAGVPREGEVSGPTPLAQGTSSTGDVGYAGPCPPGGETHDYVFRLLALDAETGLEPGADRGAFDEAVEGHVIASARLTARYARP